MVTVFLPRVMPSVDKATGEGSSNAESESLGDRESAGKPPTTTRLSALLLKLMLMLMLIKVAGLARFNIDAVCPVFTSVIARDRPSVR